MNAPAGRISLVGAGPGAADLLTLRALRRIEAADVVCYDRLVDPEVLALCRPDAERIFVGKEVGANAWPQERINGVIVAAARRGKQVVRLKSGDPSVFGRACEEIAAARAAGIEVEVIPGITAASAAAASLCTPLTERGETDRIVFATGTCKPGDPEPDWGAMLTPGTTLALYMAMHRLGALQESLLAAGLSPATEVTFVASASKPGERHLVTTIAAMVEAAAGARLGNPAIVFVRRPKAEAASLPMSAPLRLVQG